MKNILAISGNNTCMYIFKNHYLLEHYFYRVFEAKKKCKSFTDAS